MSTSATTKLPPLAEKGVFAVSSSVIIDAQIEKVWEVLLDFKSYRQWNPFVRNQQITDSKKNPLPDQTPKENAYLYISPVHIPPTMSDKLLSSSAFERISVLDHEHHRCAWINIDMPQWLLNAERWQALSVVETNMGGSNSEERRTQTRYETIEVFGGLLAYIIKLFLKSGLEAGFKAQAEGLKKRSEELR